MRFEARGLARSVEGRTLFRELDLSVEEGRVLAVAGPSGAGKTQLLRVLAWLAPPDAGEVSLDGRGPSDWGVTTWRTRVTLVSQAVPDYPGTPRDLGDVVRRLAAQAGRDGPDPIALAEAWGLPAEAWDQRWVKLSGGERQRAALAIAVSRRPDLLLLDEPTSACDPKSTAAIEAALSGRAAVWVTHDEDQEARVAHDVLRLGR